MEYLSEREVVDVLEDFSSFTCSLVDILTQLRALQPRYYSIASSPVKVRDHAFIHALYKYIQYHVLLGYAYIYKALTQPII